MYYESYQKKRRPPRDRRSRLSFGQWLLRGILRLAALALVAVLLAVGILYALPPATFAVEPENVELSLNDGLPLDCLNVLLLGTDVLKQGSARSDAMIIASIGYGKLRLTSVMRDTQVDIPGHGKGKLNAAYAYGGPELTMRTINETFGLNIMHYAQVDFVALAQVVDALGGISIPEISQAEMEQINRNTKKSGKVFAPLGYTPRELTTYGADIRLDGLQALSYARIRKIDSDFARTRRQRAVVNAIVERFRQTMWNPLMLKRLFETVMSSVNTNMSMMQILSLCEKALTSQPGDTLQLPINGAFTDNGSSLVIDNRNACREAFIRFVYD